MVPSQYIKEFGKYEDFASLDKVLNKPSDFDEDILGYIFEFLAEIQYAQMISEKWRKKFQKGLKDLAAIHIKATPKLK